MGKRKKGHNINENMLFQRINVGLLKKNKEHMLELKKTLSLRNNIQIDNSGLIRAMIEYFTENPRRQEELDLYIKPSMGFEILNQLEEMLDKGCQLIEIEEKLGVGAEVLNKLNKTE